MRCVALLHQLQKDFIFELLCCWLAKRYHIFNETEDIVQLCLLSNPYNNFEDLQSLVFVEIIHKGQSFVQGTIFRN